MNAIEITNLTKSYGKCRGVRNLNLTIRQGEFFGFIGPNGAGKSTTIRTLLGLIRPTSGNASVFGQTINSKLTEILSDIGYLPSEAVFYQGMKVKDIIKLSADLHKKDCRAEAEILCRRLQLDTSKKVETLSFGNRKKVAIVCALQHNPRLLILDEPTSGLDPLMQKEFFEILKEKNRKGTTIFMSSHILSEIQNNCTRAAIIKEGEIIACDSVEILARSNAKRVTIHGQADLRGLPGIRDYKVSDEATNASPFGSIRFLYSGDMQDLLSALGKCTIQDITITEPDLEEIFLHYYTDASSSYNSSPSENSSTSKNAYTSENSSASSNQTDTACIESDTTAKTKFHGGNQK